MAARLSIYPISVPSRYRPPSQEYRMPPHNEDWGIEQDFEAWLATVPSILVSTPEEADWFYLPVWWNRYYIVNGWGQEGLQEMQRFLDGLQLEGPWKERRVFTICEYDIVAMQPFYGLHGMTVLTGSRQADNGTVDVPLLCSPHPAGQRPEQLHWRASFVGNLRTFGVRMRMEEALAGRADCRVEHAMEGSEHFRKVMLDSLVALCPRGHGGQSFRFYEAMDMGVAPVLIGDIDTRPFKNWVDWDACSYYVQEPEGLPAFLDGLDVGEAIAKGYMARQTYHGNLRYGRWCRYVLAELLSQPG